MFRTIVKIDKEKCIGCGLCVKACHEGAIKLVDGKAAIIREDYCDGMGDCLPACPVNAISFEKREALSYNQQEVKKHLLAKNKRNWPLQLKLAPITSEIYEHAHLLIAADCTGYSYPDFYNEFVQEHIVLIGCPKLDNTDYSQKLMMILDNNDFEDITLVKMEVNCCSRLEKELYKAIEMTGKNIVVKVVTITIDGKKTN